jgi:hypothetical protein
MLTRESWFPARDTKGVIGRFNTLTVLDVDRSHQLGYETYKEIPVLEERSLTSNDYIPKKLPKDPILLKRFTDRYPEAWIMFQGDQPDLQGTALSQPFHGLTMNRQMQSKYEQSGILIWEQIADLSDAGVGHLGFGAMKMRSDVLKAMGRPVPNTGPNVQLAAGMSAADAMATVPGGNDLVRLLSMLAQAQAPAGLASGDVTVESAMGRPGVLPAGVPHAEQVEQQIEAAKKQKKPVTVE